MMKGYSKFISFFIIVFISISCSSEQEQYDSIEAPQIQIQLVNEIRDSDELIFGRLTDAEITSNGSLLLLDYSRQKIHVFDAENNFISSFLTEGRGPGEIQRISGKISLSDDDRILLFDQSQRRFSIYQFGNNSFRHIKDLNMDIFPSRFHLTNTDKLVLYQTAMPRAELKKDYIITADLNGEIQDSLLEFNTSENITINNAGGVSLMSISTPHHARNLIQFHGEKMIYSNSNIFGFSIYDLNSGEKVSEISLNRPDQEYPQEERTKYVNDLIEQVGFGSDQKSKLISGMPTAKGKITTSHYDSAGYIWLNIVNENKTDWLIFSENGDLVGSHSFEEENIININKNHIFIYAEEDDGSPVLKIFKYEIAD